MMKPSLRALCLSLFAATSLGCAAWAAPVTGDPLHDGIDLYKQQHYDEAIKVLEGAISIDPQSAPAHYYLANCYLALGKYDLADQSYSLCLKFNPPKDIAAFATKMHARLAAQPAAAAAQQEPGPPPTAQPFAYDQRQYDRDVAELKARNHAKYRDAANAQIKSIQAQIDHIKGQLGADLASDPLAIYKRGHRYDNPSAQANQQMAMMRIHELENQILQIKNQTRREAERSDSQVEATFSDLATQARATKGDIKPVLTSRSVYVRDYVHFTGDAAPPEFIVKPMKLTAGKYSGGDKEK